MNSPRPLVRLSRYAQWLRSGRILVFKEGTRNFTEVVASPNTCAQRLHNGLVRYQRDKELPPSLASTTAAKTLSSFHPKADTTPETPISEVPKEVLAELCKLVVKDITTLESPVIIRLLHCVLSSEQYNAQFRASVYTEIDRRLEASAFRVSELCAVIEELSVYVMRSPEGLLSGAWREFWQRVSSARAGDVAPAYRTLARLAPPGSAVPRAFAALETAVGRCWRDLGPADIATIAEALTFSGQGEGQDNPALLVPWLADNNNIVRLSGAQIKHVIAMFDRLRYSTGRVSELVTQYTCTHWASMDGPLLGQIMEYFRRRAYLSKPAFDAVARGVEANPGQLEKRDIFKILRVYGQLNYTPPNLGAILSKMERRFWQFNGVVLLELMASFVYIERYPTNFYKDLLSLHFLAETFTGNVPETSVRHMLELRAAFTVDRPSWKPLPTPLGRLTLSQEAMAFHAEVRDALEGLRLYLEQYWRPRHTPHMVDFVLRADRQDVVQPRADMDDETSLALLCMLPSHYTVNTKTLLGAPAMKQRHLRKLGYTVIEVEYSKWHHPKTDQTDYLRKLLSPYFVL